MLLYNASILNCELSESDCYPQVTANASGTGFIVTIPSLGGQDPQYVTEVRSLASAERAILEWMYGRRGVGRSQSVATQLAVTSSGRRASIQDKGGK